MFVALLKGETVGIAWVCFFRRLKKVDIPGNSHIMCIAWRVKKGILEVLSILSILLSLLDVLLFILPCFTNHYYICPFNSFKSHLYCKTKPVTIEHLLVVKQQWLNLLCALFPKVFLLLVLGRIQSVCGSRKNLIYLLAWSSLAPDNDNLST